MDQHSQNTPNIVLLRGAALWLLMALLLAWCMVGLGLGVPFLKAIFVGKQTRLLQSHIDFLLMTALILGFYAARIPLHWTVRWAMVIGAFGNSSLFLLEAMFPDIGSVFRPRGRLVPGDLPPLYFRQRYDDDLRIWGGGNHRLLVDVPPCTQRWFPQEMTSAQRPNRRHPIEPVLTAPAVCRQRHRSGHNKSTSCRCANRPETRHLLPGGGMRQANIRSVPGRRHLLPADSKG